MAINAGKELLISICIGYNSKKYQFILFFKSKHQKSVLII